MIHKFIHDYMYDYSWVKYGFEPTFDPCATPIGAITSISLVLILSASVSWFVFYVIKPQPGCIFEGKVPLLPLYVGDPRGYNDPRYRTKLNGGEQ